MTRSTLLSRNHPILLLVKKRRSTDATGGFLLKKLFIKILQYSQENTCVKSLLNKNFIIKKWLPQKCFPVNETVKNTCFEEHLHMAASEETLGSDCLGLSFWRVALMTIRPRKCLIQSTFGATFQLSIALSALPPKKIV